MGCDYYIYTVLKIVHNLGIALIRLSKEPKYLYGSQHVETDDYTIHPSKRRPPIDHLKPGVADVLIFEKGQPPSSEKYMSKYMELIDEYIKDIADDDYESMDEIIVNNSMSSHDSTGEPLTSVDNIDEIFIVELRAWRC